MEKEVFAQLVIGLLGGKLLKELPTTNDKEAALTKALLYMIFLSQDDAPPARQLFIQELLKLLPSLQHSPVGHTYPIVDGVKVSVVVDEKNNLMVTVKKRDINKLVKEVENDPSVARYFSQAFIDSIDKLLNPPLPG